jgi:hypothetical protein
MIVLVFLAGIAIGIAFGMGTMLVLGWALMLAPHEVSYIEPQSLRQPSPDFAAIKRKTTLKSVS